MSNSWAFVTNFLELLENIYFRFLRIFVDFFKCLKTRPDSYTAHHSPILAENYKKTVWMICSVVAEKLHKNDIGNKSVCFSLTEMPHSECLCTQSPSWTACVRWTRPRERGSSNSTTSTARNTSTTKESRFDTPYQSFPLFIWRLENYQALLRWKF